MRILLIHNLYKLRGGEDAIFEMEKNLLESHGHNVKTILFDNKNINSRIKALKLSYQLIYNRSSRLLVERAIREFNPDVIHVHNFFYVASPSILFSAVRDKIPVIVTLHNYRLVCSGSLLMRDAVPCELCVRKVFPWDGIKFGCHRNSKIETAQLTLTTAIHKLLKTWNSKATSYIALTEFAKDKFVNSSLGVPPEKIIVKANSVDNCQPTEFTLRECFFLYVGRLSQEKGIQILLKAFEGADISVEIIGDGPLKAEVERACEENQNIRYSGFQDKPYILSRLKKCKALIVPSICYENLPTAILEAFSTGTPVIISDLANLNTIVSNGYNGIHFKTGNAADLSRVIEDFILQASKYHDLYKNSHKTYFEKYTHELNYNALIDIYKNAISIAKS